MIYRLTLALVTFAAIVCAPLGAQDAGPKSGPDLTNRLVSRWDGHPTSESQQAAELIAESVPKLSETAFLSGVRGGWARYRLFPEDPSDPGLVVESTRRIAQLGVKAIFLYLSEIKGSSESTLVQVAQSSRFQTAFGIAKAAGVQLLVLNVHAVVPGGSGLPYFGSTAGVEAGRLETEFAQIRDLTAYLRSTPLLDGMTVVLKNWESDNVYCGKRTDGEPEPPGTFPCRGVGDPAPSNDNVPMLLRRSAPMARWLRNRQDAVAEGRRPDIYPSPYSIAVFHAVDLNRVHDAIGGQQEDGGAHPRVAHLLPYIGADVLTYSSWDSMYHASIPHDPPAFGQLGSAVQARLSEAFTFLSSDSMQKAGGAALCGSVGYCLANVGFGAGALSERSPDPLGLGVKRLIVSEWGVPENFIQEEYRSAKTAKYVEAVLEQSRSFAAVGIRAAFYWALYDNEQVWFKSCVELVSGKARECRRGVRLACDEETGESEIPGISCYDKNLWDRSGELASFTLGGTTDLGGGLSGAGPGYYLYRPDGTDSGALTALNAYSLAEGDWTPQAPSPPNGLHVNRAPFYFGEVQGNAFEWNRPNEETRFLRYEVEVIGPAGFSTTTTHHWLHLGAQQPVGSYAWRVRSTTADAARVSEWIDGPDFRIVSPQGLYTITPCRVLDTRNPNGAFGGPALPSFGVRVIDVAGRCGVPADAVAIAANHTVLSGPSAGSISIFPGNETGTPTESVSFKPQRARALGSIDTLATDGSGSLKVRNNTDAPIHYILDVTGYFR